MALLLSKTFCPMDVTQAGIHSCVKAEQLAKALSPTFAMLVRLTDVMSGSHSNAQGHISFTVAPKLMFLLAAPTAKATTMRFSVLSVIYTLEELWA